MKTRLWVWLGTGLVAQALMAETVRFDNIAPGALPSGWMAAQTGEGKPVWAVVADDSAPSLPNALKQSGVARFALCLKTNATVRDGVVEVKFKPLDGKEDQAGGVVWRARDADNYYVCRANALEDNVVLYKTVAGKRTALDIVGRKGGVTASRRRSRPIAGTPCAWNFAASASPCSSTAKNSSRSRTPRSPTPVGSVCGPRPTA